MSELASSRVGAVSRPLVVVGDALLDVDLVGTASRLTPDAPVPVVEDVETRERPGGAALAAVIAASGGREVVLVAPMADDEGAARLRTLLVGRAHITEKKMFGGLAFMLGGNMCCGIAGDRLMLRLGHDGAAAALTEPHTAEMDFTGRVIRTMVYVEADGFAADQDLAGWIEKAVAFAETLPSK